MRSGKYMVSATEKIKYVILKIRILMNLIYGICNWEVIQYMPQFENLNVDEHISALC